MSFQKEHHAEYMRNYRRSHPEYNVKQKENFERFLAKNPEYFREHVKRWRKEHADAGSRQRENNIRHNQRHPERRVARNAARYVPLGDRCEDCGATENLEHHHPDYSKPKFTVTVCGRCHKKRKANESEC